MKEIWLVQILSVFDPSVILCKILETVFFEEHFTRLFVLLVKIYDVKFRSVRNWKDWIKIK